MTNKKYILMTLLVATIMLTMITPTVLGAITVTINTPGAAERMIGAYTLNVSVTGNATNDAYACNFTLSSPSTGNSSTTLNVASALNTTAPSASGIDVSVSLATTDFEDSNDYTLGVNCSKFDDGADSGTATRTGLTVDNTAPTIPSALSPAHMTIVSSTDAQTFSSTVVDRETTACTYTLSREGMTSGEDYITGTGTYSGTTCSFTNAFASGDSGNWYWDVTASDGTNTTSTGKQTVQVTVSSPGSLITSGSQSSSASSKLSGLFSSNTILLIAGALVLWLLLKKK